MGNLTELLSKIQPAVYEEKTVKDPDQRNASNPHFVQNVAVLNVKRTAKSIVQRSYILEQMIEKGKIMIVVAMYDLDSGIVEFYEDTLVTKEKKP